MKNNKRTIGPTQQLVEALVNHDATKVEETSRLILRQRREQWQDTLTEASRTMRLGGNLKDAHKVLKPLFNAKTTNGFPDYITHDGKKLTKEQEVNRRILLMNPP
jgi:long-subunit acyl-CoA synthetase (AMP-forming)